MRGEWSVLAGLALRCAPAQAAPAGDQALVDRAMALIGQHQAETALDVLNPLLEAADRQMAEEKGRRDVYCASSTAESLAYLLTAANAKRSAVVLAPAQCTALFLRGYALIENKEVAAGLAQLQTMVTMAPNNRQYMVETAYALRVNGQVDAALALYIKARDAETIGGEEQPDTHFRAAALRGIGYILADRGDLDGGEAGYRESLKLEPDNPVATSELRWIAQQRATRGK